MTHLQHEILQALRSEPKGATFTAAQIRKRCPSISPGMSPDAMLRLLETTEGVRMTDPPKPGTAPDASGKDVFAARWGLR